MLSCNGNKNKENFWYFGIGGGLLNLEVSFVQQI